MFQPKYIHSIKIFGQESSTPELEEIGDPIPNSVASIPFENKVMKYMYAAHFAAQAHLNIKIAQAHQKLQMVASLPLHMQC